MKHRLFIAINLPLEVKQNLAGYSQKWPELPAKWTKPENLHITSTFIGDAEDNAILEIHQAIKEVTAQNAGFSITLDKISYGPPRIIPPKMVWLSGKSNEGFALLCDRLNIRLLDVPKIHFKPDRKENIIHITLARIKEWEWRKFELDERPEVEEFVDFEVPVKSIDLMESVLKREGPEYIILESYKLNEHGK